MEHILLTIPVYIPQLLNIANDILIYRETELSFNSTPLIAIAIDYPNWLYVDPTIDRLNINAGSFLISSIL